jgi:hypothetical protein
MQTIKRITFATLAILGLSLIFGLVSSRQVRAAVSALVTVTNDASNPVQTTVTNTSNNPIAVNFPTHLGVPASSLVSIGCYVFKSTSIPITSNSIQSVSCTGWQLNQPDGAVQDNYAIPQGYNLVLTDIEVLQTSSNPGSYTGFSVGTASGVLLVDVGTFDSGGYVAFREHLTTGFLCASLPTLTLTSGAGASGEPSLTMQGYLVPAN